MIKQKSNIKRDEYKRFLTFMQEKMGIKVLATRTCHSIEDCDVAFFKILKVWENQELVSLRCDNEDLRNDNIALELKVDELKNEIDCLDEKNRKLYEMAVDLEGKNFNLSQKLEERQENIFIRFLKFIFG